MARKRPRRQLTLAERYPPSPACSCEVCLSYCARPGWWTVAQAEAALADGLAGRMMLELAPERTFAVLSPAFNGCEGGFALQACAGNGCNFLREGLCDLHASSHLPLECSFCHHDRAGQGPLCHAALEKDWDSDAGRVLVERWSRLVGLQQPVRYYLKPGKAASTPS